MMMKFKEKIEKLKAYLYFYIHGAKLSKEQEEKRKHWIYYIYLKKRYGRFLNNLKKRKNTNKFCDKVWWCWLQGEENAPDINKACLNSLRKNLKNRDIIVITEDNYSEYVTLPQYIISKYKRKIITKTHFSDILRLALLVKYGGTWIDSSVLCTKYDEDLFDKNLFVYQNWKKGDEAIALSSWFITSEKENPILVDTLELLYKYWKEHNFLIHYFLMHFLFTLAITKYPEQWNQVNRFSNLPPHILQFEILNEYNENRFRQIEKMSSFHKLNQKMNFKEANEKSNYKYILKKYL